MSRERELLRRALEILEWADEFSGNESLEADIRAFLAAEPEATPIGYIFQYINGVLGSEIYYTPEEAVEYTEGDGIGIPVYLHPPRPELSRKPMSGDEVIAGFEVTGFSNDHYRLMCFIDGVHFAERHHGIGENDE